MKLGWIPTVFGIELVLVTQATLINADEKHVRSKMAEAASLLLS
jgi:hypothetical protein